MNVPTRDELLAREARLATDRWTLLQSLVEGRKCLTPLQYETDCGKCAVCACRYSNGARRFIEDQFPNSSPSLVPGTRSLAVLGQALRDGLNPKEDS